MKGEQLTFFVLKGMIWYIRQLIHAYMLPSVSQKQFQKLLKFSQLTRWRLRPFSSRVLFLYAFYAFIYAFCDQQPTRWRLRPFSRFVFVLVVVVLFAFVAE